MAEKTLNSKTSPFLSTIVMSSFQSNCIWRPGGVSNRGCASAGPLPGNSIPLLLQYLVKAP